FKFNLLFLPRFQGFMWATVCFSWYFQPVPVKSCLLIKLVYCINLHFITFTKPEYRAYEISVVSICFGFSTVEYLRFSLLCPNCVRILTFIITLFSEGGWYLQFIFSCLIGCVWLFIMIHITFHIFFHI